MAHEVVDALRRIGLDAYIKGRNDIELDGRKISGFAQYVRAGCVCTHCSLLYDADLSALGRILRPDREKIASKALASVESRVTNVAPYLAGRPDLVAFCARLKEELSAAHPAIVAATLTPEELAAVDALRRRRYDNPDWTYGRTPPYTFHNRQRFGAGLVEVFADVEKGHVASLAVRGDFLAVEPTEGLTDRLVGLPFRRAKVAAVLDDVDLTPYVGGISKEELLDSLFPTTPGETSRLRLQDSPESRDDSPLQPGESGMARSAVAVSPALGKKPPWLRKPFIASQNQNMLEELLVDAGLNTVCHEAACPNRSECFARKTATFMILGAACSRNCRFCNVVHGDAGSPDPDEPARVGRAVARLGLRYVVITSVTRDDLRDGGAAHFAATIEAVRRQSPQTAVEVLIPDFQGNLEALAVVAAARPTVISHNMETVEALYEGVRPQADYQRSLNVLRAIKSIDSGIHSKTGIMVGLGETEAQVLEEMDDLREVGCEFLTIGQYLAPSAAHYPVQDYIHPDQFAAYKAAAEEKGFTFVASAPYVRSSYHAGEALGL
jgi:lipoic acid synthetase